MEEDKQDTHQQQQQQQSLVILNCYVHGARVPHVSKQTGEDPGYHGAGKRM